MLAIAYSSKAVFAQSAKPVIAVAEIISNIQDFNTNSIQTSLENAFVKTNKYTIMERTRLAELMKEQGLTMAGIATGEAKLGGFSGVDYLVIGSVSNITVGAKNLLIVLNCEATLTLNIRTVDTKTGEIRFSETVTTTATVGTSATDSDPCAGITLASINVMGEDTADGLAGKMTMNIFPIKVARVTENGEIYLNYGEGTLARGSVLSLKTIGEGFLDPDTGEILGAEETTNSVIVVNDVRPSFSIGNLVVSNASAAVGDIAYPLQENRSTERLIRSCVSAQEKKIEACEKDSGGKACNRQANEVEKSCGALMDL